MSVHPDQATSRRRMIRQMSAAGAGLPILGALALMLRRIQKRQVPSAVPLPADVPTGLSIVESAVAHREAEGGIHVFSGRCTHLGCRLDRIQGEEAVCPCHGSRFRSDGTVAQGPATRPLTPMSLEPDPRTGGWTARGPA